MKKLSTALMILGILFFFFGISVAMGTLAVVFALFFLFAHLRDPIRRKWVIAGIIVGSIAPVFWWIGGWALDKILSLLGVSEWGIISIRYWVGVALFPFGFILGCATSDMPFFWIYYIGLAIINIGFYAGVFNLIGYIVEKIRFFFRGNRA
ncbi:MAG: hypothetical protein JSV30_02265 [Candidatus Omnitrophota bacterium]|nr:MAG: hypothetical protein JSV30_02265 [Candidatus Omnitrophota bacterium]